MKRAVLILALATPLPALAQDLPPDAEVRAALEAYPAVTAADARVDAARGAGDALRAGPYEVTLQGTLSNRRVDMEGRDYREYDATLSRALRLPGKAALDRKAGALGVEVAINRAEDARHQAALALAELWYRWLGASAKHRNAVATHVNLEQAARAIDRRVELRDAAVLDADQAAAAVASAALRVGDALATRDRARAELAATFPELALPIDAPDFEVGEPYETKLAALAADAVIKSHDITAADRDSERQTALARRAKLDRLPDPTLGLRSFQERSGQEKGMGVFISLPFGGSHRRGLAEEAASTALAATYEAATVRREVEAHSAGDLAETRARLAAWRAARDAVVRTDAAASKTARGQDVGVIDLADRLYADRLAYEARAAEIDARTAAASAVTKMRIDAHALWIE
ncbi:TolC family protein [Sphingomonas sp. BK235]|uniref:TolC family protein n=1 Tax=Sphingomonas sp. BK235 TaxID=2512131 RepID=UPI0010486028|nr:TolC family protein [Sphingomonas sp. BK235]TCP31004.1 outer membrane protein TolC [Sphingomonas sp. BK235]